MAVKHVVKESGNKNFTAAALDDAMLLSGFGVYNMLHMLMCGIILMGVIMQSLALGYVMPAAQCDLDLTLQQRGWLAAIPFMGDYNNRIYNTVNDMATSGPSAVVYTYLGEFNNLRHRDKMVAFGSSFVGIGTVVLPAVSWLILPMEFYYPLPLLGIAYRSWRLLVVACALPYALGAVLLMFYPDSPKFLNAVGRLEECLEVVKKIYSVNQCKPKESFEVKTLISDNQNNKKENNRGIMTLLHSVREQTLPLFKKPLLPWTCLTCFVQFGIFATTNGFYVWFPTVLNSLANHNGDESSICAILDATKAHGNTTVVSHC
ncbi:unnamed protein product [Diatraea saccharalis]|uniref:Uncharacterized protein n=1 Tax=Diatraea saccharalis TaxID=40085 RepID=A0A9N9R170_9NEOP|nr:unnamed protein product [Diatraea saccharalis]